MFASCIMWVQLYVNACNRTATMCCSTIGSCQSTATSDIVKRTGPVIAHKNPNLLAWLDGYRLMALSTKLWLQCTLQLMLVISNKIDQCLLSKKLPVRSLYDAHFCAAGGI